MATSELLIFCLVNFAFCLAGTLVWCSWLHRKWLRSSSLRSMRQLSQDMSDLHALYESLLASHQRLRSREGMQRVRETRSQERSAAPSASSVSKDELRRRAGLATRLKPADHDEQQE